MTVKYYHSGQSGAPSLTGQVGSMITVLDACLVDGYATVSVTSINRSGTTATVVTGASHGLSTGNWVLVAGAVETDYNIEARITKVDATTFTYEVANSPTTPATGTITMRRAPAGFTKTYSGTNKAAYRSNDVTGNRFYLRVQDDGPTTGGAQEAVIRGYESMSDVDTGVNPFPTVSQMTYGYFAQKSSSANSTARPWYLITNGKMIYMFVNTDGTDLSAGDGTYQACWIFGDLIPYRATDAYCTVISGAYTTNSFTSPTCTWLDTATLTSASSAFNSTTTCVARDMTTINLSISEQFVGTGSATYLGSSDIVPFPNFADNGFYMSPVQMFGNGSSAYTRYFRARVPGLYEPAHYRPFPNWTKFSNVQGFTGRTFVMIYGRNASSNYCTAVFDLTGDDNFEWD